MLLHFTLHFETLYFLVFLLNDMLEASVLPLDSFDAVQLLLILNYQFLNFLLEFVVCQVKSGHFDLQITLL